MKTYTEVQIEKAVAEAIERAIKYYGIVLVGRDGGIDPLRFSGFVASSVQTRLEGLA